jgi:hypothetical protein
MSLTTLLILAALAAVAYYAYQGFQYATGPLAFLNQYSTGAAGAY